jgi:hypothetical protein
MWVDIHNFLIVKQKFVDILCLETEAYVVVEVKKKEVSWVGHLPKQRKDSPLLSYICF